MLVNALMSAPAQNSFGLADANTSARTRPWIVSHMRSSAWTTSDEIEFAGGRSSQAIAISSRVWSLIGLSSQPASEANTPATLLDPLCARRLELGAKAVKRGGERRRHRAADEQ